MNSPAIERLKNISAFRNFAEAQYKQNAEIWSNEARHATGIAGALGVAICVVGGGLTLEEVLE